MGKTMSVKKYRKKPVTIEAMQLTRHNACEIAEWGGENVFVVYIVGKRFDHEKAINIRTLEGVMEADPGDYIIKGVQGEFYPCKPDIFAATYEEVQND